MMEENKRYIDKSNGLKASWCNNCNQAYYRNRAKYNKETHKFICPNCGK